jgi:hypothetical protein
MQRDGAQYKHCKLILQDFTKDEEALIRLGESLYRLTRNAIVGSL